MDQKETRYQEFLPALPLRPFIENYYIIETDGSELFEKKAYASGCVEIMIRLGGGNWYVRNKNGIRLNPPIELWGQIIEPLTYFCDGPGCMMGVRFYPHTAALFLREEMHLFNDQVSDLYQVLGNPIQYLYEELLNKTTLQERLQAFDSFFIKRIHGYEKQKRHILLLDGVIREFKREDFWNNIQHVAEKFGISSRYLQKLFVQYTGLSPKLYMQIDRFQNSLKLLEQNSQSLTSIAYECGYFDQAHFIKAFKSFTGTTPSGFLAAPAPLILTPEIS
ncbi:helix-turn-helix transcriptional regulator [Niabella beijingensis]|uniref:helix-turn-helix transcriptional regulator n=1 Tax=Niabella beijingensis TaxID=2872700 RepID=UPI001CC1465C|nr:helix-turn-helix transcriptional regulator [Niabella beijingensis]MBZ4190498.1 helix-turn-helix domain-containing protein [Niabella beijingensis]